jgi:hypothetical protein
MATARTGGCAGVLADRIVVSAVDECELDVPGDGAGFHELITRAHRRRALPVAKFAVRDTGVDKPARQLYDCAII